MTTIGQRARAALYAWRNGISPRYQRKQMPGGTQTKTVLQWPDFRVGNPQWHLIDINSYIEEGFNVNSLIYGAVMFKARSMTTAPPRAYIGETDNPELLPDDHPLSRILQRPNKYYSWNSYSMMQTISLNIAGDAFAFCDRRNSELGVPSALYFLSPERVYIIPGTTGSIRGYLYVPEGKSKEDGVPILPEDMIHVKLPNPSDPLEGAGYGLSPISSLARSADVDNMITRFLQVFFERGTMLSYVLSFDVALDDDTVAQVKERWKDIYGGYENWDEIGVLDRGSKVERLGMTFDEMGFSELDERNETRILSPFGVPPILIGSRVGLQRSTYSNYREARQACWEDTLVPEIGLFQDEEQYYLASDDGGFILHDLSGVPALQEKVKDKVETWVQLVNNGVPKNVAARTVGLPLPELPDGDIVYMPLNMIAIGSYEEEISTLEQPDDEPQLPEATEDAEEMTAGNIGETKITSPYSIEQKQMYWKQFDTINRKWERKMVPAAREQFENDKKEILRIVSDGGKSARADKASIDWLRILASAIAYLTHSSTPNWQNTFIPLIMGTVEDVGRNWAIALGMQFDVQNLEARNWFNSYTLKFAQEISTTTKNNISTIMTTAQMEGSSIPQIQRQLSALFDRYISGALPTDDLQWFLDRTPAYRTEMIARTETIRASNAGSLELFKDWHVKKKEWLATADNRTREDHLEMLANPQIVPVTMPFIVGGETLMYPGDPQGSPWNTINCRCAVLPIVT